MKFAFYDLEVTVPKGWSIAFDPKTDYNAGIAALRPSTKSKDSLELHWGDLNIWKKKGPDVESFMEEYFNERKRDSDMKSFEVTKGQVIVRGEHNYLPHEFTYTFKRIMKKGFTQKIIGIAMYDLHSNRFGIFFSRIDPSQGDTDEASIRAVINSLNCTCDNETQNP